MSKEKEKIEKVAEKSLSCKIQDSSILSIPIFKSNASTICSDIIFDRHSFSNSIMISNKDSDEISKDPPLDAVFDFIEDLLDEERRESFVISKEENEKTHITLTHRVHLKPTAELSHLCHLSKNLYNHANYYARKLFFYKQGKIRELEKARGAKLKNLVRFSDHYRCLNAQTAYETLRYLIDSWKNYLKAVEEWKKNPSHFPGKKKPRIPGYKKPEGEFVTVFPVQNLRSLGYKQHFNDSKKTQTWKDRKGRFHSKTTAEFLFPKKAGNPPIRFRIDINDLELNLDLIKEVRIVPRGSHYIFEVVYNKKIEDMNLNPTRVVGVDLGVNNLLTIGNNFGAHPVIIKGKRVKHANWLGNKQDASLKKELYQKLDEYLLYFLDSCLHEEYCASIIQSFNYLLEERLLNKNINRAVIHHLNTVLSVNIRLKKSTKEYYLNKETKQKFNIDRVLVDKAKIVEIRQYVEKITQLIVSYEQRRAQIWRKRNNRIQDQIHKASSYLIEYCKTNNVGCIVIGYNKGWKQGIRLGRRNTQNFVFIPFMDLVKKLNTRQN